MSKKWFTATSRSVLKQTFQDWEWVLVDDGSPSPHVKNMLQQLSRRDARIRVIFSETNGGIVEASNIALEHSTGEFVALLDHDDLLNLNALKKVSDLIHEDESTDMVYTDEDKISSRGRHYDRVFKPKWSPEKLRGQMYTGHLGVYRTELVRQVGGFRKQCEGSQDHDLALRVSEISRTIAHIPEVLYHWRVAPGSTAATAENKPYTWEAGLKAVNDHITRTGLKAVADFGPAPNHYTVNRTPDFSSPVSVIVPTRGSAGVVDGSERIFVIELARSIIENNIHSDFEFIVVYDLDTSHSVLNSLRELVGDRLVLAPFDKKFNFSEKCNLGALTAKHDTLIFINDDMECVSSDFIGNLIAPLSEEGVGATGAKLLFEDGTIQHAGHKHHLGHYTINYNGSPANSPGNFGALLINREVSGVTGACIALRKSLFWSVGGFSELFPNSFNDVDLCNKITFKGLRILWLANIVLRHFESQSRVPNVSQSDYLQILERWGASRDPYYA